MTLDEILSNLFRHQSPNPMGDSPGELVRQSLAGNVANYAATPALKAPMSMAMAPMPKAAAPMAAPQATMPTPSAQEPGFLDRAKSFVDGYGKGGLIGAFVNAATEPEEIARAKTAQAQSSNTTMQVLINGGMSPEEARVVSGSPQLLQKVLADRFLKKEKKPIEINGRLVDPETYKVLADFSGGGGSGGTEYGTTPQWTEDGRAYLVGKDGSTKFVDLGSDVKLLPPGQLAEEKARGAATGKTVGAARVGLPQVLEKASNIMSHLTALESDPYLNSMVGPIQGRLPNVGSQAERVQSKIDQITGAAFLQAFESLKGGGQITEVEGNKATAAISRLQNVRMSQADYRQAINDLKQIVRNGVIRAKVDAGELPPSALNDIYNVEQMGLPTIGQPQEPQEQQLPKVGPGRSAASSQSALDIGDGFSVKVR